ncbi:uncharacterized protein BDZ99DRAFT_287844 [Mytilinidion resinicola]|uniref:Uncharacterized protein n=1 Tax=Mytilinidion resinicola TaxID=574789 RepID=A0A6A6YRY5_9PEZI|nr:uncharacterized protein BDZ99DRAFT_287844 [Mytilinidion resinicola]KAF2810725.1 hypothetical protein BDZ99DRAFT_287844 [Mytilinidion resinicola]
MGHIITTGLYAISGENIVKSILNSCIVFVWALLVLASVAMITIAGYKDRYRGVIKLTDPECGTTGCEKRYDKEYEKEQENRYGKRCKELDEKLEKINKNYYTLLMSDDYDTLLESDDYNPLVMGDIYHTLLKNEEFSLLMTGDYKTLLNGANDEKLQDLQDKLNQMEEEQKACTEVSKLGFKISRRDGRESETEKRW